MKVLENRVIKALVSNYKLMKQDFISKEEWIIIRNAYKQLFSEDEWEAVVEELKERANA